MAAVAAVMVAVPLGAVAAVPLAGMVSAGAAYASSNAVVDSGDLTALAVESMSSGRLDLFATGPDAALHHRAYTDGQWTAWEDLGGSLASAPAVVSWGAGRLDVFARGTDDSLRHLAYADGTWKNWENIGGTIKGTPAVASIQGGHLDALVWGVGDKLWHVVYNGSWSNWEILGGAGTITSSPSAVSWGQNRIDVFARGSDRMLQRLVYDGAWRSWTGLGGPISSAPSVISLGAGHLDVFAQREGDTAMWHRVHNSGTFFDWESLGGAWSSAPAATSVYGVNAIEVFGLDQTHDVQQMSYANTTGWGSPRRVFGVAPNVPAQTALSRVSVVQAGQPEAQGALIYSYVDESGQVNAAYQANPNIDGEPAWTTEPSGNVYSGRPALAVQGDGRAQLTVHRRDGDVQARTQQKSASAAWGAWSDLGGWTASDASAGQLSDGRLAVFSVDPDGRLLSRLQSTDGRYQAWRVHDDVDLAAAPTITKTRSGLRLFALDTSGVVLTATYAPSQEVSKWTRLSEPGMTGTPAVALYPGYLSRVFVRAADGTIMTRKLKSDGSWSPTWESTGAFAAAGSPDAIMDTDLPGACVVARGTDGKIYYNCETWNAEGVWQNWTAIDVGIPESAATDPTAAPVTNASGQTWLVAFHNSNGELRVYEKQRGGSTAGTAAGSASRTRGAQPRFAARTLPAPPRQR